MTQYFLSFSFIPHQHISAGSPSQSFEQKVVKHDVVPTQQRMKVSSNIKSSFPHADLPASSALVLRENQTR